MSSRESRPVDGSESILVALAAAGIPMEPVGQRRRLIRNRIEGHDFAEFMSPEHDVRVLAVPEESADAQWREHLETNRVSVPKQVGSESGIGLWLIPPGTRTIGDSVHLIADDPEKYGRLLHAVGEVHRVAYDSGLGGIADIEGTSILDRFAFAPDVQSPEGVGVFLIPPYAFDRNARRDDFAHRIVDELSAIPDMFERRDLMVLGKQMQDGGGGV